MISHLLKPNKGTMAPVVIRTAQGTYHTSWRTIPYGEMTGDEFIDELRLERWAQKNRHKRKKVSRIEAIDIFQDELYDICLAKLSAQEDQKNIESSLYKLRRLRAGDKQLDVERARAYPIGELIRRYGYEPIRNKIHCPFHGEDRTPSLHIYEGSNSWYAFCCHKHGDSIQFVMEKQGCTFIEAVKLLV